MLIRLFAIVMALVFLVFAGLQYNDPDPYIWIPIYLYLVLVSILVLNRKISQVVLLVSALVFLIGSFYLWPAHWEGVALKNGMKTVNIEEGRESLGLAMGCITLLIYGLAFGRRRQVVS